MKIPDGVSIAHAAGIRKTLVHIYTSVVPYMTLYINAC